MANKQPSLPAQEKAQRTLLAGLLHSPAARITLGLLIGIGLLLLVLRYVNVSALLSVLQENLKTPRGITLALLSGAVYLLAWSIRAMRWKLFLNPIGKVSALKAIALYQVAVFINLLLPVQGGEVVKCFLLKRSTNIAVSASLPTVMLDKTLDLMPVLFILAVVPLLGMQMDILLWALLGFVGVVFCSLLFLVVLAAWKRDTAVKLLHKLAGLLPRSIAGKIEGFATVFIDSLLLGARQPKIFIPAVMLTGVAVMFDGLFAMLAFWAIGFPIPFGTATFGYLTFNLYHILPTPPGGIGSVEAVGLLVFSGLLHLPALQVTAMWVFSHVWTALLIVVAGLVSLSALGLTLLDVTRIRTGASDAADENMLLLEEREATALRE
ncbi:MAG: lysylphosphatidylglycerol synthase transmembrane domain-containing protein [Ktedonobacteraceae bacterium]